MITLSTVRLCVSPSKSSFETISNYESEYGGYATEGNIDAIGFNHVASTIQTWPTFRLLRWVQNLHQSKWDHEIVMLIYLQMTNDF
jgi:hypothetical protein